MYITETLAFNDILKTNCHLLLFFFIKLILSFTQSTTQLLSLFQAFGVLTTFDSTIWTSWGSMMTGAGGHTSAASDLLGLTITCMTTFFLSLCTRRRSLSRISLPPKNMRWLAGSMLVNSQSCFFSEATVWLGVTVNFRSLLVSCTSVLTLNLIGMACGSCSTSPELLLLLLLICVVFAFVLLDVDGLLLLLFLVSSSSSSFSLSSSSSASSSFGSVSSGASSLTRFLLLGFFLFLSLEATPFALVCFLPPLPLAAAFLARLVGFTRTYTGILNLHETFILIKLNRISIWQNA